MINKICDKNDQNNISIVCISDTHTYHDKIKHLPQADILIHAGDFTLSGLANEVNDFANWLDSLTQYREKIVIAGNHDITLDINNYESRLRCIRHRHLKIPENPIQIKERLKKSCIYLENEFVEVFGIKIYGSPYTPQYYEWGFHYKNNEEACNIWQKIPSDIDILITHGPPYKILDKTKKEIHAGCEGLSQRIKNIQPKFHIFGHIHEDYGVKSFIYKSFIKKIQTLNNTQYVNCAICNIHYEPLNKPILLNYQKIHNNQQQDLKFHKNQLYQDQN